MPLYEARGLRARNSNYKPLTKEQKREAHAALFGVPSRASSMNTLDLTNEDAERMRALLAQHDASHRNESKEFDLNNPPKQPYTHQPFPTTVYHHAKRLNRKAKNAQELAEALAHGWQQKPYPAVAPKASAAASAAVDEDDEPKPAAPPKAKRAAK